MLTKARSLKWIVGLVWLGVIGNAAAAADELRAGAAVVDISPRVLPAIKNGGFLEATANQVLDPLHARCVAFSAGEQTLVIAIVDSCMIPRELCDEIRQRVSQQAGIPPGNLLIAATHTHSAPSVMDFCLGTRADPHYPPWLVDRVAAGMIAATKELKPARVGWVVIDAPGHTHCRRWLRHPDHFDLDPFGQRTVQAMMHPGYQNPQYLGPAGPADTQLSLLNVQTRDGQPLCLLANYSMHYFGADQFSADYFGDFSRELEHRLRPTHEPSGSAPFVAMMSQGTSGDLHWMDYSQPPKVKYRREQYARELADLALAALPGVEYRSDVSLASAVTELALRRRTPDEARLAWARNLNAARGAQRPRDLPEVYAEQAVWLSENPGATLLLQVLRIGDLGIAAIPNEVFGITGLKLKAQSPLQPLINMELANGAEGYIPPPEQHQLGGYTTWPARTAGLDVEAEPKIVAAILELLEKVSRGQARKPLIGDFYNEQQRQAIEAAARRK